VAAATGASYIGWPADQIPPKDALVHRVVADSRQVQPGDLFAAIVGERDDGHLFAARALEAGAVAVLACLDTAVPALQVADTVTAIGDLARNVLSLLRQDGALEVIGITGSAGKTSTKDLLAHVLGEVGPTVAPRGSFNTELGLPLTILDCDQDTRFLILEMGARGIGHIAYLTGIGLPRIGVVLGVGSAHLGEFGSREAIAVAKGELVEGLPSASDGGVAVLNADDPLVAAMATRTSARTMTFGTIAQADVWAEDIVLDAAARPAFRLHLPDGSVSVALRLHGLPAVTHALAAAAVASSLGISASDIGSALATATAASPWRMEVSDTASGVTVVNDAYNANPESMRAAMESLAAIGNAATGARRTWAVLGMMHELGASSVSEHEQVGRLAVQLDVSRLVVVGEQARAIQLGAIDEGSEGDRAVLVPDTDAAVRLLRRELRRGDVVLVKASRAEGLERVAAQLLADEVPDSAQIGGNR
jgi:UDP-N-acetylmuramoyl-tripeptide--D-alanyl-D-alanine ligase